jgi:16S rRNA (guanine(966)-N(2))-methyltransferase RsmD
MRIISGKNKGRHIITPQNLPVRPTTDLGKESLFNILNHYFYFDRVTVLDLFAGTGNITYEFASRDAISVVAVDNHPSCCAFIRKTLEKLQYKNATVIQNNVFQYLDWCKHPYDIIFADPPYTMPNIEMIVEKVFNNQLLNPDGWLVMEHSREHDFSQHPFFYDQRKYGRLHFSFLVNNLDKEKISL